MIIGINIYRAPLNKDIVLDGVYLGSTQLILPKNAKLSEISPTQLADIIDYMEIRYIFHSE